MNVAAGIFGVLVILAVLWDTFQTIVLPRTVEGGFRLTTMFYRSLWPVWSILVRLAGKSRRETVLSVFGPLSLILLIVLWAALIILGFALVNWSLAVPFAGEPGGASFGSNAYFSGVTFFTLGFGDITPVTALGRSMAVTEAGMGFGFLAVVISYLPVLYQSFSRREVPISLLDARAGTPPSCVELLRRMHEADDLASLKGQLVDWERWAAELLESYLSYPVLAYYRSQHERQSWLAAITAILDTCAVVSLDLDHQVLGNGSLVRQSRLTFAMARHACVDLALIFSIEPKAPKIDRLPESRFEEVADALGRLGITFADRADAWQRLSKVRAQYEPYVDSIGRALFLELPPFWNETPKLDNWQVSAWDVERHF